MWRGSVATRVYLRDGLLYFIAYAANALSFWEGSRLIADAVENGGNGTSVGAVYTVIFVMLDGT